MQRQIYEEVTASILKDLEAGVASWVKPWKSKSGGILPYNHATGRKYSGVNIPILWHAANKSDWPTLAFLTYKQAQAIGAQVRAGEKSTRVVYTNKLIVGEGDDAKSIGYLKAFYVFNISQMDGIEQEAPAPILTVQERDDAATSFIKATGADIRHGGDRAYYRWTDDFISLPNIDAFESYEHYLATSLHELCHWSGNEKRLNRELKNRFGTKAYAAEELVAELGAAFLCAHLGVQGQLRHAEYIANWIELLKEDERAVFTAASKASQAADYLRNFSEPQAEAA